jgi:hypothetical protein
MGCSEVLSIGKYYRGHAVYELEAKSTSIISCLNLFEAVLKSHRSQYSFIDVIRNLYVAL